MSLDKITVVRCTLPLRKFKLVNLMGAERGGTLLLGSRGGLWDSGTAQSSRLRTPHREAGEATRGGHHHTSAAPSTSPRLSPGRAQAQAGSREGHLRASLLAPLPSENRLCSIFMYL